VDDKNEDKTVKLVCGPMRKHLFNGPQQKSSTCNGNLEVGREGDASL